MELPAFLNPILSAPRWQRGLLGGMGVAFIVGGAWVFILSPIETRISGLSAERTSLQREITEGRRIVADLARFRVEIAELEQKIEIIKEKLPTQKDMPPLYRSVSDAAFQSGLGVGLFQPREPRTTEHFNEIPIAVNAEGGYHQVGEFFERLAGLARVVNVTEWKLSGATKGKNALVKADMTLATYMVRPPGAPPPGKPGAQRGRPAPAKK